MLPSSTTNRRRRAVEAANATKALPRLAADIHVARLTQAPAQECSARCVDTCVYTGKRVCRHARS